MRSLNSLYSVSLQLCYSYDVNQDYELEYNTPLVSYILQYVRRNRGYEFIWKTQFWRGGSGYALMI